MEVSVRPSKHHYDIISYHCVSKLAYLVEHGICYQPSKCQCSRMSGSKFYGWGWKRPPTVLLTFRHEFVHEFMCKFAREFVDEVFTNFVHQLKYEIRTNSIRINFFGRKLVMLRMASTVNVHIIYEL